MSACANSLLTRALEEREDSAAGRRRAGQGGGGSGGGAQARLAELAGAPGEGSAGEEVLPRADAVVARALEDDAALRGESVDKAAVGSWAQDVFDESCVRWGFERLFPVRDVFQLPKEYSAPAGGREFSRRHARQRLRAAHAIPARWRRKKGGGREADARQLPFPRASPADSNSSVVNRRRRASSALRRR